MTGPRFTVLAAELRERIALGDYAGSGALESEAELGRRYGMSRVTVRRALEQLRGEGLVGSRKGSGWYVSGGAYGQPLALGSFTHAASAVAAAGERLVRAVTGYGYQPAPPGVATLLGGATGDVLCVRSVRRAGAVALDAVTEWVPLPVAAPVSRADAEEPGTWETLRRHGHRFGAVRQRIAAAAATDAVAAALGTAPGTPVLLVRRLALEESGAPLALSDHHYLGHRFQLEVEFRGWPGAATEPPGLTAVPEGDPR